MERVRCWDISQHRLVFLRMGTSPIKMVGTDSWEGERWWHLLKIESFKLEIRIKTKIPVRTMKH